MLAQRRHVDAPRTSGDQERRFGRAPGGVEITVRVDGHRGLVAEHRDRERSRQRGLDGAGRGVTLEVIALGHVPAPDRHAVLGDGAGLVDADHGRRAQALDRVQASDEHASLEHPPHAESQRGRRNGRQPLGHCGDRQRGGGPERDQGREAAKDADHEQRAAQTQRRERKLTPGLVELALERRSGRLGLAHESADLAELRPSARGRDDGLAGSFRDDRAGVHHVVAVRDRGIEPRHRLHGLGDRHRFTREGGLVRLQSAHRDQSSVGGHVVARPQEHHVAGHQLRPGQELLDTVAAYESHRHADFLERSEDALDPRFGGVADAGVDHDDREDRDAIHETAGGERRHGGPGEQPDG
jgi:hypothetical protein